MQGLHSFLNRFFFTACLVVLPLAVAEAASTVVTENTETLNLVEISDFLEDPQGHFTLEDLEKESVGQQFEKVNKVAMTSGMSNSVFWLRFDLRYDSDKQNEASEWLVEVDYPALDLITLYAKDENGEFQEYHSGDKYPFDIRAVAHPSFLFPIVMKDGANTRFYIRLETSGVLQVPARLWSPLSYLEKANREDTLYGVIYGILLVMLLYHFLLFIRIKDVSYLFYTSFIGSLFFYFLSVNGVGLAHLWPSFPLINSAAPFFLSMAGVSAIFLGHSFLKLSDQSQALSRFFTVLVLTGLFIVPLSLITGFGLSSKLVLFQILTAIPILTVTGLYCWFKRDKSARFFFAGFLLMTSCVMVYVSTLFGLIPTHEYIRDIIPAATAIVSIILALGLASRTIRTGESQLESEHNAFSEQEKVNHRLMEANKLKDDFLKAASHELKTPMTGIVGSLDLLKSEMDHELIDMAWKSSESLNEIVSNLLVLSEMQAGSLSVKVEPFKLSWQFETLKEQFQLACDAKGVVLTSSIDSGFPETLYGDAGKLFKAVSCVLDNAVKFTQKGEIKLSATQGVDIRANRMRLVIVVEDSGGGIQPEKAEEIYQAFQTHGHDPSQTGLGLGLSVCRQLMQIMGGTVSHSPCGNGGTRFELSVSCWLRQ